MNGSEHEEFEVLIEKRLRGAEPPDERRRLDERLAACEACRRALAEARETEAAMRANAAAYPAGVDWEAMRRTISARFAIRRHRLLTISVTVVATMLVVNLLLTPPSGLADALIDIALLLLVSLAVFGILAVLYIRDRRLFREAVEMPGGLPGAVRAEQRREVRRVKVQAAATAATGAAFLGLGLLGWWAGAPAWSDTGCILLGLCLLAVAVAHIRKLPRIGGSCQSTPSPGAKRP